MATFITILSSELRFNDDAIRFTSNLTLGANLHDPHVCLCCTFVNWRGTRGLSCKRGSNKLAKYAVIKNLVHRALVRERIPYIIAPTVLSRSDGKRPNGLN